jgi:hypothetical protein
VPAGPLGPSVPNRTYFMVRAPRFGRRTSRRAPRQANRRCLVQSCHHRSAS